MGLSLISSAIDFYFFLSYFHEERHIKYFVKDISVQIVSELLINTI